VLVFGLTDANIEDIFRQQGRKRMTYSLTSPQTA